MGEPITEEDKAVLDGILNLEDPTDKDIKWIKERGFSPDRALSNTLTWHSVLGAKHEYTSPNNRYEQNP